tara:strand:+ start:618 stop:968 length:351 start_codon:yes stop_codon:yes gene_type:complete
VKTKDTSEIYQLVERALDEAVLNGRFLFKMYTYLKAGKWTRRETNEFIESSTAAQVSNAVEELNGYIKGGDKQLREAYGHIPKPKARKIRDYLYGILEDAWTYHAERKPGRKKSAK